MAEPDVVVAGGGPAGLATAIFARAHGLRVVVVDRRRPPLDKACGEGLMPDGVRALAALGVQPSESWSRPFVGIRYVDADRQIDGRFARGVGLGIRRTALQQALTERAEGVGVDLRWGVAVRGLIDDGLVTDAGTLRGRFVVAADGLHSRLRRRAGLDGRPVRRRRFGIRRHYAMRPWSDRVEVHWADGCEAYVTPLGESLLGVAMLWHGTETGFEPLLRRFPQLARRLAGQRRASADRGSGPLRQRTRAVVRGRLALVGDAAGYVDAITGEGLALAFRQAQALAAALAADRLEDYRRQHRRICRRPNALTHLALLLARHPGLRRQALRGLGAWPGLFDRVLRSGFAGPPLAGRQPAGANQTYSIR